jgi:type II secretory pathway pseudopilin PulG
MQNTIKDNYKNVSGFTLIEILVGSALIVLLGVAFVGLQYILSENQTSAWRNYLSLENANGAVSTFAKEIRNARQSELGSYPLVEANDQEIIFYSDYDYDGTVERVRYTLSGTNLVKGIIEPAGDPLIYDAGTEFNKTITNIARNETDPLFYYYNSDWPTDTTNNPLAIDDRISDTTEVKIILQTNPDASTSEYNYKLESSIKVRMLN